MQNDKLKSVVLFLGSLVLLFLVATNPQIQKNTIFEAATRSGDSVAAEPAAKAPAFAGIVGKNMSFFNIMRDCGIDPPSIKWIEKAVRNVYDFRRIHPGQRYEVYAAEDGSIERLHFSVDDDSYIHVDIKDGEISAEKKNYEYQLNLRTAAGTITKSLFESLDEQGIPQDLGYKLTNVLAWDIDFHHDLRTGDYYRMIYEERTRFDGLKKIGRIVAMEFNNQGRGHYAFLFPNEDGKPDYYDENGKSLRKQLLKAPLPFTRISSRFSRSRFHPVLHHYAPHLGVDFAAPVGTPVQATGDGIVMETSRNHANGNYIKIRHFNNYITYYLHLSRFAAGIHPGARVNQKDVIGYVGMTGYATGPHLDYRVMKDNRFINPQTISLPPANPVTNANMASFIDLRDRHLARLSGIKIADGGAQVIASGAGTAREPRNPAGSAGADRAQSAAPY
jgi:murein DD-endopeptidase MepM/ murein hydrolase activator NlpD